MNIYIMWTVRGMKLAAFCSHSDTAVRLAWDKGFGRVSSWYVGDAIDARNAHWLTGIQ